MNEKKTKAQTWTFLTNHAHVMLCLAKEPSARMCDISASVGITERAVQRIIAELNASEYVEIVRQGRRNSYKVHGQLPLRHPIEQHQKIDDLISLIHGRKRKIE